MAKCFIAYNFASPTTAAPTAITTGTAIKTLLQIATPSTSEIAIVEWGISFDGNAAATPIKVELIETDVAATVTAHVAAGVVKYDQPGHAASIVTLGTTATGYTASGEGTTTASRLFDMQLIAPTNQFAHQFPLGREPVVAVSKFLRIRVTAAAAVNAICYVIWEE